MYLKKQKLNEQLYQLHLHSVHQWLSTWSYIQDIVNNQILVMTENLYEALNNRLNHLRRAHKKKTRHQPKQIKPHTKISSQNPEFDGCPSFPKRNRNAGNWYPAQLRKIYKIMFRDVVIDKKKPHVIST